jgi:hypothetical protein
VRKSDKEAKEEVFKRDGDEKEAEEEEEAEEEYWRVDFDGPLRDLEKDGVRGELLEEMKKFR